MPGRGDRGGRERPKNAKGTLKRTIDYLMDYKLAVAALAACALISNAGNLLGLSFAGKAINAVTGGAGKVNMPVVIYYARLMLFVYAGSCLISMLVNIGMMRISKKICERMRQDVFEKLMKLPVGFFDQNQAGDIISRVSYDIDVLGTSLSTDVVQIIISTVTVAGSFLMMCIISLPLTACMLVKIPLSIAYTRRMRRITRPLYAKRSAAYGRMNGYVEEMFTGQKTILAYAHEDGICEEFKKINHDAADAYFNADSRGMTMGLINNLGLSLIGMTGAGLYLRGIVSMGQISSFILYSRKFSGPINEIANIINEIFSALAAAERIFRLLDEPEEAADIYGAKELTDVKGDVKAEHVSFGYLPGKTILHDLNLHAQEGRTVAIVGPTGAGKSTIINLLMRFTMRTKDRSKSMIRRSGASRAAACGEVIPWCFRIPGCSTERYLRTLLTEKRTRRWRK